MDIVTFCSFKGGTSKTSNALHIGAYLAKKKKVLLVDLDPQANLSIGIGIGPDTLKTMVPVLQGEMDVKDAIHPTYLKNLSVIPSNAYLDGIERTQQLGNDPYAHERLRRALQQIKGFDYCFIDTPPSLGWLTQSAFFASSYSVICAIPEAYSIIAMRRLKEFHDSINEYHEVVALGVVLSFWNERGAVNNAFLQEIEDSFSGKIFSAKIRRDILVSRAVLKGKPVFELNPQSRASIDYKKLTDEFVKRIKEAKQKKEVAYV